MTIPQTIAYILGRYPNNEDADRLTLLELAGVEPTPERMMRFSDTHSVVCAVRKALNARPNKQRDVARAGLKHIWYNL